MKMKIFRRFNFNSLTKWIICIVIYLVSCNQRCDKGVVKVVSNPNDFIHDSLFVELKERQKICDSLNEEWMDLFWPNRCVSLGPLGKRLYENAILCRNQVLLRKVCLDSIYRLTSNNYRQNFTKDRISELDSLLIRNQFKIKKLNESNLNLKVGRDQYAQTQNNSIEWESLVEENKKLVHAIDSLKSLCRKLEMK